MLRWLRWYLLVFARVARSLFPVRFFEGHAPRLIQARVAKPPVRARLADYSERMWTSMPDNVICERARLSRDARFDGLFFVAVLTTGIFCRPICPARTPRTENVRFFPSVVTALDAGYRPCLRCRPERAPQSRMPAAGNASVLRALEQIEAGVLDDASVARLAETVGLSARQLTRLFVAELGVAPGALAQARRISIAKQLIDDTTLSFAQIAALAGFRSLRRFNEAVQQLWSRPPSALRTERASSGSLIAASSHNNLGAPAPQVRLKLALRPPYHCGWMLAYLAKRAIPGVESVQGDTWTRTLPGGAVQVQVRADALMVTLHGDLTRLRVADVLQRIRRVFDVAADGRAIDAHLGADARLSAVVLRDPGLRVPGAWDGFEVAVRAVLGQQVSVAGATTLAARLVQRFGTATHAGGYLFPDAAALVDADVGALGMPESRGAAVRELARAVLDGRLALHTAQAPEALIGQLIALPGIGPWTAQYVAMRVLGDPDAFPAEDIVLRKIAEPDVTLSTRALLQRAEDWRPWRAYAVMYLWSDAVHRAAAQKQRAAQMKRR